MPVGRRLAENGSNATLNDPQEAVAWLLTSMAESHYALVPHLTPGELFEVTSPSMRFRSRRMERGESHVNQTVERCVVGVRVSGRWPGRSSCSRSKVPSYSGRNEVQVPFSYDPGGPKQGV